MKSLLRPAVLVWVAVCLVFAFLPAQSKLRDESLKVGEVTCDIRGGCDGKFNEYYRLHGFPVSTFKQSYKDIDAACAKIESFGINDGGGCSKFKPAIIVSPAGVGIHAAIFLVGLFIIMRVTKRANPRD